MGNKAMRLLLVAVMALSGLLCLTHTHSAYADEATIQVSSDTYDFMQSDSNTGSHWHDTFLYINDQLVMCIDVTMGVVNGESYQSQDMSADAALPYGHYTLTELRSDSNEGYELITCDFWITRETDAATTTAAVTRQIDWESLPESVIAWVEVPGTEIDYAIAMGPEADPDYYLTHDAWGNYIIYGVPYVTPLCTEGLVSRNVIIYGHNMSDGSMFAGFANFKWPSVAAEHSVIKLYVRANKSLHVLHVIGVNVVDANVEEAQSEFADSEALTEYVHAKLAESEVVMRQPTCVDQLFTFVTCSYDYQNGRTLVYAIEEE